MIKINLQLFATNITTDNGLSAEMKTHWDMRLLDFAKPNLVYDQFAQKRNIPANKGKTIEFRRFSKFPKALNALTEGTPPAGQALNVTSITSTVSQFGDYVAVSDVLDLTALDPVIEETMNLLGAQAGETGDTITRDIVCGGSNSLYAPNGTTAVKARADIEATSVLTPAVIRLAAAKLKRVNATPIDNAFVGIVHPDVENDILGNSDFLDFHKYAKPENIYNGEIGMLSGVRFVRSSEAKIIAPAIISDGLGRLTCKTKIEASATAIVINEVLTASTPTTAIPVYIDGVENTITAIATAVGVTTLTIGTAITALAAGDIICGKGAGKDGTAVYCTMILGSKAYATIDVEGGGLEFIVKQSGSGGTSDPLNQLSTCGWKMLKTAERLSEENMIRVEHSAKDFAGEAVSN